MFKRHNRVKPNVKINENFSQQRDLWSHRKKNHSQRSHPRISPGEGINRGSSLWEISFIDDSFLICPFTDGLSEDTKKSYIAHPLLSSRNLDRGYFCVYELNHHVNKKWNVSNKAHIKHFMINVITTAMCVNHHTYINKKIVHQKVTPVQKDRHIVMKR